MKKLHLFTLLFAFFCLKVSDLKAQVVFEPTWKSSYDYLSRLAQRGIIDFDDVIQPVSRKVIQQKLDEAFSRQTELTPLEKKELEFYLKDYHFDRYTLDTLKNESTFKSFFGLDQNDRFRWISIHKDDFGLNVQPIIGASLDFRNGESVFKRNSGFWLYGYVKKRFGYSFSFNEANESGPFVDKTKAFSPETGFVGTKPRDAIQYSDFRTNISYNWDWGQISAGRDHVLWGYGTEGRLVSSAKPPAYPFVRLEVNPTPWLGFHMSSISLNSMVPDSSTLRSTKWTSDQIDYVQKNLATHSFIIKPLKGLSFALGESIIYNNRLKLGYLVPLAFFRAQSHYEGELGSSNTISNSQFFLQFSSRDHIPNTHLYFSFFIDEMSFGKFFDKEEMRNQTGYTGGVSVTNFPLANMYFISEYTRTRPYNYQHFIPAQTYTNNNYNLGHWIGSNADQWISKVRYRVSRGLTAEASYSLVRKGDVPTDSTFIQNERGTPFLYGDVLNRSVIQASLTYELMHDLFLNGSWQSTSLSGKENTDYQNLSIALRFGF